MSTPITIPAIAPPEIRLLLWFEFAESVFSGLAVLILLASEVLLLEVEVWIVVGFGLVLEDVDVRG